jgi:hypothetical protein
MAEDSSSPCEGWEPYKYEKCFKIFDNVGLQTYDDAIKTCQQQGYSSSLVSIRSLEEHGFLNNLLFKTHNVVDAVWIGAKYSSNKFKWADDSDLSFTNWAEGSPSNINITGNNCIQIMPEGSSKGKWIDEPCKKKNLVVCQKMQTWSLSLLQKALLDTIKELNNLKQNPVPIGFIYAQLPGQPEPKNLWPMVEWKDVTSDYAGLFFRAEGGGSAAFGKTQDENCPRVTHVKREGRTWNDEVTLPVGEWSGMVESGQGGDEWNALAHRFFTSAVEVRPRNKAVRIWKRTN